jgi:hypothetical protein
MSTETRNNIIAFVVLGIFISIFACAGGYQWGLRDGKNRVMSQKIHRGIIIHFEEDCPMDEDEAWEYIVLKRMEAEGSE